MNDWKAACIERCTCSLVGGRRKRASVPRRRPTQLEERARLVNRIQKVLEDSNVKLASVATDITGVSGRAILQALLEGQEDPEQLAELARGRMRCKGRCGSTTASC